VTDLFLGLVGGYLLGTVSFARLVARRTLRGQDISTSHYEMGDKGFVIEARGVSPGAVGSRAGRRAGGLATLGDISKAAMAVGVAWWLLGRDPAAAAGAGAVLGHVFPVQYRFKGAFGQSPIIGASLVLSPLGLPFAIVAANLVAWALGEVTIGSVLWPVFLIIWGVAFSDNAYTWFAVAANALYLMRVGPQIAQRVRFRRANPLTAAERRAEILSAYRDRPF
jgi:acyl phosphate:glycerol-3-phosphate acyltransferase